MRNRNTFFHNYGHGVLWLVHDKTSVNGGLKWKWCYFNYNQLSLEKETVKNVIFLALLNRESKFGMSHIVCDGYHVASSSQVLYASNLMKLNQPNNALDWFFVSWWVGLEYFYPQVRFIKKKKLPIYLRSDYL